MKKLFVDIFIIAISIALAFYLSSSGAIDWAVSHVGEGVIVVSLVAGFLFTSFFTTPVAIAMFSELAADANPLLIASIGGAAAVAADSILFYFVRGRVAKDAKVLLQEPHWKKFVQMLRRRRYMRLLPVVGAIIIASPFPDEIGLALIGISKIRPAAFALLAFSMNALGILLILLVARSL